MKEMSFLFKCWPRLWKLELHGNLLCLKNKYRERIIVLAPNLESLDGKEIQEMSRQFLQNWKNSKEVSQNRTKPETNNTNNNQNEIFATQSQGFFHSNYIIQFLFKN
jgi:protein phosphatase 1 regulatory subunit 42